MIIVGCGSVGISISEKYRREVKLLSQLIWILHTMKNELQYRLTVLPELCRKCGQETTGILGNIFQNLAIELDKNSAPDVDGCMAEVLDKIDTLPKTVYFHIKRLGQMLGRFDLPGQIEGIDHICTDCEENLRNLQKDQNIRLRNYRTLGLCGGVALAILLV